jgi:hypothetical protein
MNAAPPVPYFCCRTCGSREYERVVVRRRDGKPYDTAFYACMGCTTMFGDPTKYSAPPPPAKVTRVDAPISYRRSREGSRFDKPVAEKGTLASVTAISRRRGGPPPDE